MQNLFNLKHNFYVILNSKAMRYKHRNIFSLTKDKEEKTQELWQQEDVIEPVTETDFEFSCPVTVRRQLAWFGVLEANCFSTVE